MKSIVRLAAFCLVVLVLLPPVWAQQVSLTILHTNDTHSHLLPFSYPSSSPPGSELSGLPVRTNIGGIARRATLVKRLRGELESQGTTVWLIDAGDFTDGTPFSTEYHGEADVAAMNAVGYTFATLGNHEFNNSLSRLKTLISQLRFPLLCANATDNASGALLTAASQVREVGPLKIGIFGLLARETQRYQAATEGITIAPEIETAQRMVKNLRAEAGIVVLISHAGERMDQQLASTVPGLDVIVGGHSHSRLPTGEFVWRSDNLKPAEVNGTIVVQAFQWGGEVGRLDLLFSKDSEGSWHVSRYRERLIPVTSDIPEDPAVAAVVDRYWKPISERYGEVVGHAAADFALLGSDEAYYNLVADVVRAATGAQIDLENTGGVRAPLVKGDITVADVINMDPFSNTVVTFKITGRQLKEILRKARPFVSGLRYRMERGQIVEATVGGQAVEDDRVYSAASNSYMAGTALKGIEVTDTGKLRRDFIIEHIRKKGTIQPVYDGRRVVIDR